QAPNAILKPPVATPITGSWSRGCRTRALIQIKHTTLPWPPESGIHLPHARCKITGETMTATTMLDSFDALLQAAHEQPEPQRLLLVFVKTVLPEDADEAQSRRFESGQGGGLVPVMYVDKDEDEIEDFAGLLQEAEATGAHWGQHMTATWDMVIVGCLGGLADRKPTAEDAEEPLTQIIRTIHYGGSLAHLAAFDRQGHPVRFE